MTKKLISAAAIVVACAALCCALTACMTGTMYTSNPSGGDITFDGLNEETSDKMEFNIKNVVVNVELTSGYVDIAIYDCVYYDPEDTDLYGDGDLIKEAKTLRSGGQLRYSDDDGSVVVYVTGHDNAKGKITFSEQ